MASNSPSYYFDPFAPLYSTSATSTSTYYIQASQWILAEPVPEPARATDWEMRLLICDNGACNRILRLACHKNTNIYNAICPHCGTRAMRAMHVQCQPHFDQPIYTPGPRSIHTDGYHLHNQPQEAYDAQD